MITISKSKAEYNSVKILIKGHSQADICSAVSSVAYTCINILLEYDPTWVIVEDNKEDDYLLILITKTDYLVELVMKVMFQMFKDIEEQVPTGSI